MAGVQLDLPAPFLWRVRQALSARVDPFTTATGWVYDDSFRPLFRLGPVQDGFILAEDGRAVPIG